MFGGIVGLFRNGSAIYGCAEIGPLESKVHDQISGNHERDDQSQPGDDTGVSCHCSHAQHASNYRVGTAVCQLMSLSETEMATANLLVPGEGSCLT